MRPYGLGMVPEHPKKIARIGAIVTLLGSLVWVQWPIDFEKFNVAALILLIGSFFAWISIEISTPPRADEKTHPATDTVNDNILVDDVEKINSIIKIIDSKQYYILKRKSIQTYMGENDYKGLLDLIYFKENDIFPFHNKEIQTTYENFCEDVESFHNAFYELYTSDGRGRSTWRSGGDLYVSDEEFRRIMSTIGALNRQSSALAASWEDLIKLARRELKGASKAIDRYET